LFMKIRPDGRKGLPPARSQRLLGEFFAMRQ
jgi:hypothetical protein